MTTQMIICFAISAVVIAGYIWNKLSVGTVGCIGIVLFLLTGCIGPKDILGNIGNANLVMITSMFVISEGFKRTKAIHLVASTVKKQDHLQRRPCQYRSLCNYPGRRFSGNAG